MWLLTREFWTTSLESRILNRELWTANFESWNLNREIWTANPEPQNSEAGILSRESWTVSFDLKPELRIPNRQSRFRGSGFAAEGSRCRFCGSRFTVQDSRFRIRGSDFAVQDSWFAFGDSQVRFRKSWFAVQDSRLKIRESWVASVDQDKPLLRFLKLYLTSIITKCLDFYQMWRMMRIVACKWKVKCLWANRLTDTSTQKAGLTLRESLPQHPLRCSKLILISSHFHRRPFQ